MLQRQEVINVILAQLLAERGLVAAPEQIYRAPSCDSQMPDVIVEFEGLRVAVEAEFASTQDASKKAFNKAKKRVEDGIAHLGVAVVYPESLRRVSFEKSANALLRATIQFTVVTELSSPETQLNLFDKSEFKLLMLSGTIDELAEALRRSYDELIREDTVQRAVEIMEGGISSLLQAIKAQPATVGRLAGEIGIIEFPQENEGTKDHAFLSEKQREAVNRIAALIIENALIFQEVLSQHDQRIDPLERFRDSKAVLSQIRDHWKYILDEINYFPIFYTARQLLGCFSIDEQLEHAIKELVKTALRIVACRAALRHDLAGRIYHRLLEEAKYLGAYYTSIPAAIILLKLALRKDRYLFNWSSQEELQTLHIADLACGTGTLLMAAADAVVDNHVRACVESGKRPDLTGLQQKLVANSLYGYDVLASAIHLTASTLSLRVPETPVNITHLYKMILGGPSRALGSLEFLESKNIQGFLFGAPEQATASGSVLAPLTSIPRLDLCVMNPPFTRSVGCNLLFGNFPEEERKGMQSRLRQIVASRGVSASITAGLGAPFVALAEEYIKPKGSIALVLPHAVLAGVSWKKTRELLEKTFYVEYIVVSHEPGHWNFSENTSLSETLVVARRLAEDERSKDKRNTIYVNLWEKPKSAIEALSVVSQILSAERIPQITEKIQSKELELSGKKIGELSAVPWEEVKGNWSFSCSFAQGDLNKVLHHLLRSKLLCLETGSLKSLPLVPLGELGELGFDRRDVHDGFTVARGRTPFPAVWGQVATRDMTLLQRPTKWLQSRYKQAEGRPKRDAEWLWKKAGRILIAERFRINTMRLPCTWVEERVLANVWWTYCLNSSIENINEEKALVLWLNSTLGLIMLFGYRTETEGPWVDFKKPLLERMPVLDVSCLNKKQLSQLGALFDKLSTSNFQQLRKMKSDPLRIEIDESFSTMLGLAEVEKLRNMLANEPLVNMSFDGIMQ